MDIVVERAGALDVHKKTVMACVRDATVQRRVKQTVKQYGTTTSELLAMADWLAEQGVTHVAMESTGVYWKPIWNLLEGRFELLLVNAQHVKKIAGRKTDVKDCQWLAQLLQHGLLRPSFVPPRPLRELRDLTRYRTQIVDEKTRVSNRIQKVLEDANIKLTSVASDLLGLSGRLMLDALCQGQQDPDALADLAQGHLRPKIPRLREALRGHVTDHHRFMLQTLLQHLRSLEAQDAQLTTRIEAIVDHSDVLATSPPSPSQSAADQTPGADEGSDPTSQHKTSAMPLREAIALLDTLPGVNQRAAQCLVAELGTDMTQFPSAANLASWAKVCPGNNESAGKRRNCPTGKGNPWFRRSISQAACSAGRMKKSYFCAQYRRLAARRGKARAVMAVAHSMVVAIFHMISKRVPFNDLGPDFFDRRNPDKLAQYFVRRLQALGHQVTLQPQGAPMSA